MALYYWRNALNDRDGTDGSNYDDAPGGAPYAADNPPGADDNAFFDGNEDFVGLPTSMPAVLNGIVVAHAYAGITDFTDFAVGASWSLFTIDDVTLQMSGTPTILAGGTLDGGMLLAVLKTANPIATAGACAIAWNFGFLNILGGINASHAITHYWTSGSKLTCDVAGTLNLGGVADDLEIENTAAITLGDDIVCGSFTMNADLDMASKGLFTNGSYVYASGTLSNAGTLTMTGTGNLNSGTTNYPDKLALSATADITLVTGDSYFASGAEILENAQLDLNAHVLYAIRDYGDHTDPLRCEGTVVGAGSIRLLAQNVSNDRIVDFGDCEARFISDAAGKTWTQTKPLTCGDLQVYSTSAGNPYTLDISGANAIWGDVTLGMLGLNRSGILILGNHTYSIGTLASGDALNVGNAITLAGANILITGGGTLDADNIVVSADHCLLHQGILANCDKAGSSGMIYRFGATADHDNSLMDVVHCPSPLGPGLALMAA